MSDAPQVPLLAVTGATKAFGGTVALSNVDLEVAPGEIHALVGGNGSGKSTLLKILAGVHHADAGSLQLRSETWDLRHFDGATSRRTGLRFVHQQPTVFTGLTVMDNLCLGARFDTGFGGRIRWGSTRRRVLELLERFSIEATPDTLVGDLSPAARTMVEVARTMQGQGHEPASVLALDEPTAALPHREVDLLLPMLRRYASEAGQAILFVTHRLDEVLAIADRVTVLRDGENAGVLSVNDITKEALTEAIIGRPLDAYYPEPVPIDPNRRVVLSVRGLAGGGLRNIDFDVAEGEVIGIAGHMGSGRTTLLEVLFGATPPSEGSLLLDGSPLRVRNPHAAIKAGIGYVPEDRIHHAALPSLSVAENLAIVDPSQYWHTIRQSRTAEASAGARAIDAYDIRAESPTVSMASLSGGNQQKVVMARWLSRGTRVLLLDEPTQAVDVGARTDLWRLIRAAAVAGTSVVIASSDLEELAHLCDRVLVLAGGKVARRLEGQGSVTVDALNRALLDTEAA